MYFGSPLDEDSSSLLSLEIQEILQQLPNYGNSQTTASSQIPITSSTTQEFDSLITPPPDIRRRQDVPADCTQAIQAASQQASDSIRQASQSASQAAQQASQSASQAIQQFSNQVSQSLDAASRSVSSVISSASSAVASVQSSASQAVSIANSNMVAAQISASGFRVSASLAAQGSQASFSAFSAAAASQVAQASQQAAASRQQAVTIAVAVVGSIIATTLITSLAYFLIFRYKEKKSRQARDQPSPGTGGFYGDRKGSSAESLGAFKPRTKTEANKKQRAEALRKASIASTVDSPKKTTTVRWNPSKPPKAPKLAPTLGNWLQAQPNSPFGPIKIPGDKTPPIETPTKAQKPQLDIQTKRLEKEREKPRMPERPQKTSISQSANGLNSNPQFMLERSSTRDKTVAKTVPREVATGSEGQKISDSSTSEFRAPKSIPLMANKATIEVPPRKNSLAPDPPQLAKVATRESQSTEGTASPWSRNQPVPQLAKAQAFRRLSSFPSGSREIKQTTLPNLLANSNAQVVEQPYRESLRAVPQRQRESKESVWTDEIPDSPPALSPILPSPPAHLKAPSSVTQGYRMNIPQPRNSVRNTSEWLAAQEDRERIGFGETKPSSLRVYDRRPTMVGLPKNPRSSVKGGPFGNQRVQNLREFLEADNQRTSLGGGLRSQASTPGVGKAM